MENLVTVKTFTYAHEASMAKSLLASEGIYCFLKDELTIQANPFYSNALGGVKLQVRESDIAVAADILKRADNGAQQTITIRNDGAELKECPACESEEISLVRKPSRTIFGLSLLLLGLPFTIFPKVYHCYNCGKDIRLVSQ